MSYSVELAQPAVRKIVGWNLSSRLQSEFLRHLDGLGADPARHLVRLPEPADTLVSQFTARDPGHPPRDCLFSLSVAYKADEETLVVTDCDLLVIDVDPTSASG